MDNHDHDSGATGFIVGIVAIIAIIAVAYFAVQLLSQEGPPSDAPGIDVDVDMGNDPNSGQ